MGIKRVLIANRGAIAVRILKTLQELKIESVAIQHSDEGNSPYLKSASFVVDLGNGSLTDTFLNIDKIISIAKEHKCDAIHPGYGFLSENYLFAKACENNHIKFIGPNSSVIRLMGLKSKAKEVATEAKVPIIKSLKVSSIEELNPEDMELPILIKAVAGGGGRGLKIVKKPEELEPAIKSAQREAKQYFGNDELMLEPFIENARHIEVQILGNDHGEITHLFERECSIQRNHQKIIEEAPAPNISDDLKEQLYAAAIRFSAQLNYTSAGTVEFLVKDDKFWFLEMNTRIQVEHAVSELITGIDIVQEQINIANGERFSNDLLNVKCSGHAIEARLYAENPYSGFQPSAGKVRFLQLPEKVRFDTFLTQNTQITPHFDSLLGKLIVHKNTREEALEDLKYQLKKVKILGIKTNISYLSQLVLHPDIVNAELCTTLVEKEHEEVMKLAEERRTNYIPERLLGAFIYVHFINPSTEYKNLWQKAGVSTPKKLEIVIEGLVYKTTLTHIGENQFTFSTNNQNFEVNIQKAIPCHIEFSINGAAYDCYYVKDETKPIDLFGYGNFVYKLASPNILRMASAFISKNKAEQTGGLNQIRSGLFGKVIDVFINKEQVVKKGEVLVTIESMKTENSIVAPADALVADVYIEKGAQVSENVLLADLIVK